MIIGRVQTHVSALIFDNQPMCLPLYNVKGRHTGQPLQNVFTVVSNFLGLNFDIELLRLNAQF